MIKFEDLLGKNVNEVQEILEKDNDAFKAAAIALTKEELDEQESIIISAMDEYDKFLDDVNYELQKEIEFDHKVFDKTQVSNYIVDFINTQEVDWQYSLGMYQLCKLWKSIGKGDTEKINYKALDSTLRLLGTLKYKGYQDWKKILAVNQFLRNSHDEYNIHTTYMIYLSHLHNTILTNMGDLEKNGASVNIMESENV